MTNVERRDVCVCLFADVAVKSVKDLSGTGVWRTLRRTAVLV